MMDRFKHLLVVAASLVLAAGLSAVSAQTTGETDRDLLKDTIGENTAELEQLRSQIEANRKKLDNLENREAEFQRGHDEIQQDMELSSRLMGEMVQREIILQEQAELLKTELDASADVYQERKSSLAESLRAMYIRGETNELEALLTSKSFSDLVSRMEMGKTLARLQASLLQEVRVEGARIQSEQRQLNASLAEIWQNREELLQETGRLEGLQAEHMDALRDLESTRKGVKSKLMELSLNEQKLTFVLEDLEQQRVERAAIEGETFSSMAASAGQLEWPVQGELIRGFGRSVHPRFKTVTLNNGVNIAAASGSPVAAVAVGKVEFADELPGFGECVILDHGSGYYTLYAHLDRVFVAKGEEISRGQVVAEVGTPAPGERPQLYFEVRHGRTPLDPADWLLDR